jgi:hypothetical protein
MGEVVCTVIFNNDQKRDLVLPDNVPTHQLANVIALALKLPRDRDTYYELKVPDGKTFQRLPDSKTLQQSYILNGSRLYLSQEKEDPNSRAFLEGANGLKMRLRENTLIGRLTPKAFVDIDLTPLDQEKVVSRRHAAITHVSYHYVIKANQSSSIRTTRFALAVWKKGYDLNFLTNEMLRYHEKPELWTTHVSVSRERLNPSRCSSFERVLSLEVH